MIDTILRFIFNIALIIAYMIGVIGRKIESIFTFCLRKYYGYRYRTVEDAVRKVIRKKAEF